MAYVRGKIFSTPPWDRLQGKVLGAEPLSEVGMPILTLRGLRLYIQAARSEPPNPDKGIRDGAGCLVLAVCVWFVDIHDRRCRNLVLGFRDNPLLRADEGAWADALSSPLKSQGFMDVADPGNPQPSGDME